MLESLIVGRMIQRMLFSGSIISLAVRLGILMIASYVLFWRAPRIRYPQINLYRAGVNGLTFIITAVYWIFYSYKVFSFFF